MKQRAPAIAAIALLLLAPFPSQAQPPAEQTEIKVALAPGQLDRTLSTFGLNAGQAETRTIDFFDTAELELFKGGVVLRARRKAGGKADTTVKLRPMDPGRVDKDWLLKDDFKCETDMSASRSVQSCSLTAARDQAEIAKAASDRRHIKSLFSKEQEQFLEFYASLRVPWAGLQVMGPVLASVWKFSVPGFADKIALESWRLPDGRIFPELSTRTESGQALAVQAQLLQQVQSRGLALDPEQESKTRVVLEYFSRPR